MEGLDFLEGVTVAPELVGVIPALLIIGFLLKKTPNVPDWTITWALPILGVVASIFLIGPTADGVLNGIIAGGLAIAGNQVYKQTKERQ